MQATKRVSNGFGHIEITKAEFEQRWLDYAEELRSIFKYAGAEDKFLPMQFLIQQGAGKMWNELDD